MSRRVLLVLATVLAIYSWGAPAAEALRDESPAASAVADVECGGPGQFACFDPDLSYAGPYNGCDTDRLNNIGNICFVCGAEGQVTCQFGLTCDVGTRNIANVCTYSGDSAEPTTNVSVMPTLTQASSGPVRGIVDLHAHQFSNLGFGGVVFWGAPYDAGGINEALPWCDYTWKFTTKMATNGATGPILPFFGYEVHGAGPLQATANPIGIVTGEGFHDPAGTGSFKGWPQYTTMTHQQMYYKWVERAFLGGVRMMVQLAVSNEALCKAGKVRSGWTCDDMEAVDREIEATKELEKAIDKMDDGQVNGTGWYQIAYSPFQAREIIRSGKMAIVLGIEVDSLFGCKPGVTCSSTYLKAQLKKYYDLGVRHVFPIHQFDNGFGGAAVFRDELNAANRIVSGHHFQVRDCSAQGYCYNVSSSVATDFLAFLLQGAEFPDQAYYDQFAADCNSQGLTDTGRTLINAMMDTGFIIDIDHMSRLMMDDVLQIAEDREYPLVSGHSSFHRGPGGSEFSITQPQMATLKELGGMVSAINPKGECNTSAGFAYHYKYAKDEMAQTAGDPFAAVGFSTDMNGFGGSTSPRFGIPDCAPEQQSAPETKLTYPFTGIMGGTFNRQKTGDRTFDFNTDGLAQYGLLADFFADVRNNFVTEEEFQPLLNSAESYIRLWTRTDPDGAKPSVKAVITGTLSPNGFAYTTDVHLKWEVTGAQGFDVSVSGCGDRNITQDTGPHGLTYKCTAKAYYEDASHNKIVVGQETKSVVLVRDTTPPTLTWGLASPAANAAGWHNSDVTFTITTADATTPVYNPPTKLVLTTEGDHITGTVTITDYAGNSATFTSPAVKIDKTAPDIVFVSQTPANAAGWYKENPTLTWSCSDTLSGPAANEVTATLTVEGAGRYSTGRCLDVAGNAATNIRGGLNLDKTAPTLAWAAASPTANGAGWNNTNVVFGFTPSDGISGVASTSKASPLTLTAQGSAVAGTVTVTDVAGNSATFTSPAVKIDKTAPTISFVSHLPAANGAGWNRADPTLTWSCADALSGPEASAVTQTLTTEGAGQSLSAQCTDLAGNQIGDTRAGLNLDKTAPTLNWAAASPSANAAGWNNTDVTFSFTAADGVSGVGTTSQSSPLILSTEGDSVTGSIGVTDVAGNTATFESPAVKIDKTPPTIAWAAASPAANDAGWNNTDVVFGFTPGDSLSGVGSTSQSSPLVLTAEGAEVTGIIGVTDVAGNIATFTSPSVRIDKTPPVIACAADPSVLWPPNNKLLPVTVSMNLSDALSGGTTYVMSEASSNESGAADDIVGFTVPGQALSGALRAQRDGNGTGRVYTLGYTGRDLAGNTASCATTVAVPHEKQKGAGKGGSGGR